LIEQCRPAEIRGDYGIFLENIPGNGFKWTELRAARRRRNGHEEAQQRRTQWTKYHQTFPTFHTSPA
jgi:hypothetical protein